MLAQDYKELIDKPGDVIDEYTEVSVRMLKRLFPGISEEDLCSGVKWSINKRMKDAPAILTNTYKNLETATTAFKMIQYIASKKPILTTYGVLFTRHGDMPNPIYDLIQSFADNRQMYKDKMLEEEKGSHMYKTYNLLQLLAKIDINAIYGCMAAPSSFIFNVFTAPAITMQGQSMISTSITFFESFLAGNYQYGSNDEIITFIDNVTQEMKHAKTKSEDILDRHVTLRECFMQIMTHTGYKYIPTQEEMFVVWDILSRCSNEELDRLYYKNNLLEFCSNRKIIDMLNKTLWSMKKPFLNPNKPTPDIKPMLDEFLDLIREYVYYEHMILDKRDRVEEMMREIVLIVDTDSCIVSFESWYRFLQPFTRGIDMPIKHQQINVIEYIEADEFGDLPKIEPIKIVDYEYEYDFASDDLIQQRRMINPMQIIPEDGVRSSIINIMSYVVSNLLIEYFDMVSVMHNCFTPGRKCLLIMKNEYLFKSILLGYVKKNYASNVLVQEGHMVPKSAALNITGLTLNKSGTPKSTGDALKKILFEEILDNETGVDQLAVIKKLAALERKIYHSLLDGETKYYKPDKIKPFQHYKKPMSVQGIKGGYLYNQIKDDDDPLVDLDQGGSILTIKANFDKHILASVKDSMPERYKKIVELQKGEYKSGMSSISIPYDATVPEWLKPFIDYNAIILDNIAQFPLDSVGILKVDNDYIHLTNIASL